MKSAKYTRIMNQCTAGKYQQSAKAVFDQIPDALHDTLSASQLALIMDAINAAYHAGKHAAGAEVIDGDYVWIDKLGRGIDLAEFGRKDNAPHMQ